MKRWYVVHAYSGFEKSVAQALRDRIVRDGMEERFGDVLVPTEEVVEMRAGQKRRSERKFFPGYVLVQIETHEEAGIPRIDNESWHLVKETPRVMGFIGGTADRPLPIADSEAEAILNRVQEGVEAASEGAVRAGPDGSCHRWPVQRFQRCRRRSQLREEPSARLGADLRPCHPGRARVRPGRKGRLTRPVESSHARLQGLDGVAVEHGSTLQRSRALPGFFCLRAASGM